MRRQNHNPYIEGKYGHLNPNDVVFTPSPIAKKMCNLFPIEGKVLEPCKGEGAFMEHLPPNSDWCEITEGRNFYDYENPVDWIVTNPPYSDFNRFLAHSFDIAANVALLVPLSKMFKSMGTIRTVMEYGGIVEIHTLPSSAAGFPFGYPSGAYWIKRGYAGATKIKMFDL